MMETAEGWVLAYRIDEATGALRPAPAIHLAGKKAAGLTVLGANR